MKNIFLVDADDTILDFHDSAESAMRYAFDVFKIEWSEARMEEFRAFNATLWEALERKELTRDALMENRFSLFFEKIGLKNVDGKAFNETYLRYLSTHPVYIDGAEEFLKTLGENGEVYIVTNGTEWIQRARFTKANLWQYVKDVFISQAVGADKPAKAYTDYVTAHIPNFKKARAVWIGDSLSADMKAANDAGITSIWFSQGKNKNKGRVKPDFEAKSFAEILEFLKITGEQDKKNTPNV